MKYNLVFEALGLYIKIMSITYCSTFSEEHLERLSALEDLCYRRYQRRLMKYQQRQLDPEESSRPTL